MLITKKFKMKLKYFYLGTDGAEAEDDAIGNKFAATFVVVVVMA
jgi:hypothetical protein